MSLLGVGRMTRKQCSICRHLSVIVSQTSDYWCSKKNEYLNLTDFKENCTEFEKDNLSLTEKENRVW